MWCNPCLTERMSQRDVERTLGRLLTDPVFGETSFGTRQLADLGEEERTASRQFRSAPFEPVGAGEGGEQEAR